MQKSAVFHQGTHLTEDGAEFTVYSRHASQIELCLFDKTGNTETGRLPMRRGENDLHQLLWPMSNPGCVTATALTAFTHPTTVCGSIRRNCCSIRPPRRLIALSVMTPPFMRLDKTRRR